MPDALEIVPARGPVVGVVRPPGSKSLTNRALVCAALARGKSTLRGALRSDDTRVMIDGLRQLGLRVEHGEEDAGAATVLVVQGAAGPLPAASGDLFIGNSGTTVRFLTAMLSLGRGEFRLDGVTRMRKRPIADLVAALACLGGDVHCENNDGCPPVLVRASGLAGGEVKIRGDASSQFLSGLLMAAPCAAGAVEVTIDRPLVSKPYVTLTLEVMRAFGVEVEAAADLGRFSITPACYVGRDYDVEPDASAASYFFAAAAITGGRVRVEGLSEAALQGDVGFVSLLGEMGCQVEYEANAITVAGGPLRGIVADMNAISDTAQTLAAVALFAEGPTTITGIAHNRHKETDRIEDLATELRRVGAKVETSTDGMTISPGGLRPAAIETYDDHRMAMSMALVGLRQPGIVIKDPGCTAKTYPAYFQDLEGLLAGNAS